MKKRWGALFLFIMLVSSGNGFETLFVIIPSEERAPISQYIYGTNHTLTGAENWTVRRLGGNRMTGYNWENNASNAGKDWHHSSDNWLTQIYGIPASQENIPAILLTYFHDASLKMTTRSLLTLQMAGYVARDKSGEVYENQTAPSDRWIEIRAEKGSPFSLTPDLEDNYVYLDELVNLLVQMYGNASTEKGVMGYCLDNEPGLWASTHPRIHPAKTTCEELVASTIELVRAIKNVDPYCETFGPVLYGFNAYHTLQDAPDWNRVQQNYQWFIEYYLSRMKQAADMEGKRLLDVLDLHWYPEARGDHRIVFEGDNNRKDAEARIQAPRTLWDPNYFEAGWIGTWRREFLPLLPKINAAIEKYYPGTKLSITEYCYGGENHISGGIAMADVLGIFGKYGVYLATYWQTDQETNYTTAAFKIYRNYDGHNATFGNTKVKSLTMDRVNSSIYAAIHDDDESQLHFIVINKHFDQSMHVNFNIQGDLNYSTAEIWTFDENSSVISLVDKVSGIVKNSFKYELPKLTVAHFVLTSTTPVAPEKKGADTGYLQVHPNPFNAFCEISYKIDTIQTGRLTLYNLQEMVVQEYDNLAGSGRIIWDATDRNNIKVASGKYFIFLETTTEKFLEQVL